MTDAEGNLTGQQAQGQWRWERDESGRGGWWAVSDADGWQAHRYWTPHAFSAMQWLVDTLNDKARLSQAQEENERLRAKAVLADEAYWMVEAFDVLGTSSGGKQYEKEESERQSWLARYDALTPAADAAEGGKG